MSKQEVLIADEEILGQKIARIQHLGIERLCVVSDWDRTLTKARTESGEDTTSYQAIVHSGCLGDGYRDEMDRLFAKYRPIEMSQTVSTDKKQAAMLEWWALAFDLMTQFGLTEEAVEDIGRRDLMRLREGAEVLLQILEGKDISMQILSAGLGDVIEAFLKARDLFTKNINVTANMLAFDHKGVVTGFVEPVIHTLNKRVGNGFAGPNGHVILLGDTLEDVKMVEDAEHDCVIRVGFLNEDVEKNCEIYLSVYDVIICYDGAMHYVVDLIEEIYKQ